MKLNLILNLAKRSTTIMVFFISLFYSDVAFTKDNKTLSFSVPSKYGEMVTEVHYGADDENFAEQVSRVLKVDAAALLDYFQYIPIGPVHFIINSKASSSNGSATAFPENIIKLNNFPPIGRGYLTGNKNWIKGLVLHELVHILHMDQTRGFPKVIRSIFGAAGKWNGIVPRWFSEGIATWAETKFTGHGRNSNEFIDYELYNKFLNKKFCKTIDCLSNPGIYPGGHSAYWIGGRFIEFIEQIKPNGVRCLLDSNSDNVMFFLSTAFKECYGVSAQTLYNDFYEVTLKKWKGKIQRNRFIEDLQPISISRDGAIDWQSGFKIINGNLLAVEADLYEQGLVQVNLKSGERKRHKLSKRVGNFSSPSNYSKSTGTIPILTHFSDSYSWSIWDTKEQKIIRTLEFPKSTRYAFQINQETFLLFQFEKDAWRVLKFKEGGDLEEVNTLIQFPKFFTLTNPQLVKLKKTLNILVHTYDSNSKKGKFNLELINLASKKRVAVIYQSNQPFKTFGSCKGKVLLKDSRNKLVLFENLERNEITQITLNAPWLKNLIDIEMGRKNSVYVFKSHPHHIFSDKIGCTQTLKDMNKGRNQKNKRKKLWVTRSNKETKRKPALNSYGKVDSYPKFKHFAPNYWLLNYANENELSVWEAQTSLVDPKKVHSLSLSYNYYSSISESAPVVNYSYNLGFAVPFISYLKSFSQTGSNNAVNSDEVSTLGLKFRYSLDKWSFSSTFSYDLTSEADFISSRKSQKASYFQFFNYQNPFRTDFLQNFSLVTKTTRQFTEKNESFWGLQLKSNLSFNMFKDLNLNLQSSWGKYYKSGLSSGVIFGGGSSSFSGRSSFHEFYGIPYGDILGNKLTTARGEFEYNFWKPYHGNGFIPVYFKELMFVAGGSYVKSDIIFLDKVSILNEDVQSVHIGIRSKITVAYLAPVKVDLFYVKVLDNRMVDDVSYLVQVKANLFN
jgi:hypothetical protein